LQTHPGRYPPRSRKSARNLFAGSPAFDRSVIGPALFHLQRPPVLSRVTLP